ncbi:hypothetical protein HDU97_004416 [Phlyctochytrium planicorne]|nr:hypothetical protein HDU97_004416 [Phlyctochytrium planicorne]
MPAAPECVALQEAFPSLKIADDCCKAYSDSLFDVYIYCALSTSVQSIKIVNTPLNQTFPQNLYKFPNLYTIRLENAGITGELPEYLSAMKNLQGIQVAKNQMTGTIPQSYSQLRHLTQMLDSINYQPTTTAVNFVRIVLKIHVPLIRFQRKLDHNRLIGSIPAEIATIKSLKSLIVNDNQLSGNLPDFSKILLTSAVVDNNYFSGTIPGGLRGIGSFTMSGNCFSDSDLANIRSLNLTQRPPSECATLQPPGTSPPITPIPTFTFATTATATSDPTLNLPDIPTGPSAPGSSSPRSSSGSNGLSSTDGGGSSGTSPILIIAPTILGVLLVAALGAFLFVRHNKKNGDPNKKAKPIQPNSYPMQTMQGSLYKPDLQPVQNPAYPQTFNPPFAPTEKSSFMAEGNLFAYNNQAQQPYPNAFSPQPNENAMYAQKAGNQPVRLPFANQNVELPFKSSTSNVVYAENNRDVKVPFESNVRSVGSGKADYVPNVGSFSGGGQGSSSFSQAPPRRTTESVTPGIVGWSASQVTTALTAAGVNPDYVQMLKDRHVDGRQLVQLDHERLQIMGLEPFDARVLLLIAIGLLKERNDVDRPPEYS